MGKIVIEELQGKQRTKRGNDQSRSQNPEQLKRSRLEHEDGDKAASLPFPWKVHEMLDDADRVGFARIISWLPDCNAFRVHEPQDFVERIMPRYFHQTQFKSFQRQLNLWGFKRIENGPNKGGYFHQYFVRKEPELCRNMKRIKIKGSKKITKAASFKDSKHKRSKVETMSGNVENKNSFMPTTILSMRMPPVMTGSLQCDIFDDATLSSVLPESFFGPPHVEEQMNLEHLTKTPMLGELFKTLHVNTVV